MTEKEVRRISRGRHLTPDEAEKYRQVRAQIEGEKPKINARIRAQMSQIRELAEVFAELKQVREQQGLSLSDLQDRTGIDRSTLSKLETGQRENFTLDTILRYASAVDKQVVFALADKKA